jgi:hypothetical protein
VFFLGSTIFSGQDPNVGVLSVSQRGRASLEVWTGPGERTVLDLKRTKMPGHAPLFLVCED